MNEDCSKISCAVPKNAVQEYLNQYSLNQVVVKNSEFVAVINGVTITIPAGTFSYPVNSGTSISNSVTFQGCQSLISTPIPPGASFSDIEALVQQMLNEAAQQQAQCNAAAARGSNQPPPLFLNQAIQFSPTCTPFLIQTTIPSYITRNGDSVILSAGIFSSNKSQDDANNKASEYLNNLLTNLSVDGLAFCGCQDPDLVATSSASFVIPNIGNQVTITVSSTVGLVENPSKNQLSGVWYWAGLLNNYSGGMQFSIDSIVDSTHILVTCNNGLNPGDEIPAGALIVKSTNPEISVSMSLNPSVAILAISSLASKLVFPGTGCSKLNSNPWNGIIPFFVSQSAAGVYTLIQYDLFGIGVITINKIVIGNSSDTNSYLQYSAGGFWSLFILCDTGEILWAGVKYSGNGPGGIYYSTHSTILLDPPCITLR